MRVRLTVTPTYRITRTRVGGQGSRCESGADPPLSPGKPLARVRCRPLVRSRTGKARRGRPGSQETSLRPQARSPRGKGWLLAAPSSRRPGGRFPLPRRSRRRAAAAPARPSPSASRARTARCSRSGDRDARRPLRRAPATATCDGNERRPRALERATARRLGRPARSSAAPSTRRSARRTRSSALGLLGVLAQHGSARARPRARHGARRTATRSCCSSTRCDGDGRRTPARTPADAARRSRRRPSAARR